MTVQPGVHRIRQQHRIVDRGDIDAELPKYLAVVFHVLPDFQDRGILQHRGQQVQRIFKGDLPLGQIVRAKQVIAATRLVDERDIAGFAGFDAKRYADQLRDHIVQPGGLCIDGNIAEFVNPVDPGLQRLCVADMFILIRIKGHVRRGGGIGSNRCVRDGGGLFAQNLCYAF